MIFVLRQLFFILALSLYASFSFAQEKPNAMIVHQFDGRSAKYAITDIDSIDFPDKMQIHLKEGTVDRYDVEMVDSIGFAALPEYYEAIDLGLTIKWAAFNIGATRPEEYGDLFSWGETMVKSDYSESTYTYYTNGEYEIIGVNICGTKYDVARQAWGGQWRLPTRSEIADLTGKCTWVAESLNGILGYRVTGPSGNSIFLPSAGYQNGKERAEVGKSGFYWSGNLDRSMTSAAYNLNFRGYDAEWTANRILGFSVRAVR